MQGRFQGYAGREQTLQSTLTIHYILGAVD